jgi:hypothetical protein
MEYWCRRLSSDIHSIAQRASLSPVEIAKMLCHVHAPLVRSGRGGLAVAVPLHHNHGLQVLALLHLGLDSLNDLAEVWGILYDINMCSEARDHFSLLPRPWSTPPGAEACGRRSTALS